MVGEFRKMKKPKLCVKCLRLEGCDCRFCVLKHKSGMCEVKG